MGMGMERQGEKDILQQRLQAKVLDVLEGFKLYYDYSDPPMTQPDLTGASGISSSSPMTLVTPQVSASASTGVGSSHKGDNGKGGMRKSEGHREPHLHPVLSAQEEVIAQLVSAAALCRAGRLAEGKDLASRCLSTAHRRLSQHQAVCAILNTMGPMFLASSDQGAAAKSIKSVKALSGNAGDIFAQAQVRRRQAEMLGAPPPTSPEFGSFGNRETNYASFKGALPEQARESLASAMRREKKMEAAVLEAAAYDSNDSERDGRGGLANRLKFLINW
eukprot:CAMPEP_0175072096 /NCGR_PEP_ID=MMETSP0052_2-20121109/19680_1 /TAXON_ID=51329 ORGANISM="Polytomella parva, Strain SAG 63-3" /NCGR_SAMPLE_ID=MMETSP0052_2 /ASSEMBLY_ACC=CAM_ASM_000194 /LENGTH=275 /DNA_ID=CAMNT_0016339483 /DNA_START=1 /DNA_END=825 /DNA_ORIENTATION=-